MIELEPKSDKVAVTVAPKPADQTPQPAANPNVLTDDIHRIIAQNRVLFFQVSFLYTNSDRERILRIINHAVKVSNSVPEIYQHADYTVVGNCIPLLIQTLPRRQCPTSSTSSIPSSTLTTGSSAA